MTTLEFARRELSDYFQRMTGELPEIALRVDETQGGDFFSERCEISVKGGEGMIAANCPRALLLGVYAFLRECGCRFVRPGKLGEIIPVRKKREIGVVTTFSPTNRHRGITIEGAVSLENVLDIIDWAPKVGFNSYFTQFTTSYEFFDRWYEHKGNPFLPAEKISESQAKEYIKAIIAQIKLRSMIYHAVGHGWTTGCLGLPCNGWSKTGVELPEETRALLAEIGGERKLFKNTPLNTNLCYSNPRVRELMVSSVVRYAEEHPETDVIHFWLADDYNNVCECAECAKRRVTDYYVMMLNEIDRRMTARGLNAKICFLVYFDLYWAPETERIEHEDRFIMMFAPIFRSYEQAFKSGKEPVPVPEYRRNKVEYPREIASYLAFYREWRKVFKGDSFDFDYHLMWDINRDFGGETIARVLYEDIRSLKELNINGLISCQVQRAFYPNGLAFYLMGRALTEGSLTYGQVREEYYAAAFGKNKEFASKFYSDMERLVSFSYMNDRVDGGSVLADLKEALGVIDRTLSEFPSLSAEDETRAESLAILRFVAENIKNVVTVLVMKIEGRDREEIEQANLRRKEFFNRGEVRFQPYADGFYVNMIVDGIIDAKAIGIYAES